ncbi:MAG: InlB B-repeat-containing protein, partial [Clostridia bacterium]|nr:InlB B-repeat-containing protein [Clostridia bacterium]
MKFCKRLGILLLALLCALPLLSSCKKDDEEETVYYTVTFNSNGGSPVEQQTVAAEEAVREPTPPTREGYVFEGWRSERGSFWNFSSDFVTEDMELTAVWLDADDIFDSDIIDGKKERKITGVKKLYPTIAIPSIIGGFSVTEIGDGAFAELSSKEVQEITLPQTITSVGAGAFYECSDIAITFDPRATLTEVGESAFYGCNLLSSVRFGEGLTSVA